MKVLITRPLEESLTLANSLKNLGYNPIIEPLLKITYEKITGIENLSSHDAIIITSKNALKAITNLSRDSKLLIVGEESTNFAKTLGFYNTIYGGKNIEELKEKLPLYKSLLYLSGSDITDKLASDNYLLTRKIVYKSDFITKPSPIFFDFIKDPKLKIVLFFSSRTAQNFKRIIKSYKLNSYCHNIFALTLSHKIAHNLVGLDFRNCFIAEEPNQQSMINLISKI